MWLCAMEAFCNLLDITDYAELLGASNQSADHYHSDDSSDAQLPVLQEPGLLDLESYLHVQHAELIQEFEKRENDAEFPCCSCEQLLLRKQVTTVKLSNRNFSSDLWKTLKTHISKRNSTLRSKHTMCVTTVAFGSTEMPCRCLEWPRG